MSHTVDTNVLLGSPLSSDEATSNVEALVAPANIRVAGEGGNFWGSLRTVTADVNPWATSCPTPDPVALMREHGVSTIWSHDGDFKKFRGITVKDPFGEEHSTGFE